MNENIYSIEEIRELINLILKRFNVKKAVLFGSYAKKCAKDNSDIDIFVDSDGVLNGFNFFTLYDQIESRLDKNIDMFEAIDVEEGSRIYSEIINHGVILYE